MTRFSFRYAQSKVKNNFLPVKKWKTLWNRFFVDDQYLIVVFRETNNLYFLNNIFDLNIKSSSGLKTKQNSLNHCIKLIKHLYLLQH